MEIHTTTDPAIYRRALEVLAHNRYVVVERDGNIVDTSVLQDGDTLLAEVVPEGVGSCDVCGFSVEHDVHDGQIFEAADDDSEYFEYLDKKQAKHDEWLISAEAPEWGF